MAPSRLQLDANMHEGSRLVEVAMVPGTKLGLRAQVANTLVPTAASQNGHVEGRGTRVRSSGPSGENQNSLQGAGTKAGGTGLVPFPIKVTECNEARQGGMGGGGRGSVRGPERGRPRVYL